MNFNRIATLIAAVFLLGCASASHSWGNGPVKLVFLENGRPEHRAAPHGRGNAYAPEVVRNGDEYWLYYGGQARDGHDRIGLATSRDGNHWEDHGIVFDVPGANHVNDPSIVRVGDLWRMYYTRADEGIIDSIALAESDDGRVWVERGIVFAPGEAGAWDSLLVGRPSVLYSDGKYRMWYDGRKDLPEGPLSVSQPTSKRSQRSVGYAESSDGIKWQRHPRPVMNRNAGAVQVAEMEDSLVMVIESHRGTLWATSANGIQWKHRGLLLAGGPDSPHGHVTPFLLADESHQRLFFGAAYRESWNENRLAWCDVELPLQTASSTQDAAAATSKSDKNPAELAASTRQLPLFERSGTEESPHTASPALTGNSSRPNLVMIFTDDQRHDAVGYGGNEAITTPHLDRLARQGVMFSNCFVNTSICAISRANLLSGQYPDRHGIKDFYATFTPQQLRETAPCRLRDAGYQTAFFGKWGIGDTPEKTHQGAAVFDYWAGQPKQTNYFHESDCRYVNYDGFFRSADDQCDCPADKRGKSGVNVRIGKETLRHPIHHDSQIIPMHVRRFLDGRDQERPFCMMLFFKSPHGPFGDWDPETRDYTNGKSMPISPAATLENASKEPLFIKQSLGWAAGQNLLSNPERHQSSISDYYRSISSMDLGVGRIMDQLRERGLDDNTVVLFTSDNGHFSGEHGLGGKWLMYEPSLRVPGFLCDLRHPMKAAKSDELVITTDFSATMLALAGLPIPETMTGMDLTRLVQGNAKGWREELLYDHPYAHGGKIPTTIGVRTRTHTYTRYTSESPPPEQLFDNEADPDQLKNLADDPKHQTLLERLRYRCDRLQGEVR